VSNGRFVGYYRVSTKKQGRSGLGLDAQKYAVTEYLNGSQSKLIAEETEIESGKRSDRPALARALALCRLHGATLVVAKMDRLARNVRFISTLMESGVDFVACDIPQANKLTVHILAAVAEAEAEAISARTKAALAAARARGVRLGGDRGNFATAGRKGPAASAVVRMEKARQRARDLLPVIEAIRADGVTTLLGIAAVLNGRDIPTARNGKWSAVQVQRVLQQGDRYQPSIAH